MQLELSVALHFVPFCILTIWGNVHIEETVVGCVTNFGWKPPLHNSRNFISRRSTSHATQSFMPLRASSHPGSPNPPSWSAWYSCWPGLSPWGESGEHRWHTTDTPLSQLYSRKYACRWTLYWHGQVLIPAWKINDIHYKVRGEITYPIPNYNDAIVWERVSIFIRHFIGYTSTLSCLDLN